MMKYAQEQTILVWTDSEEIENRVKDVVSKSFQDIKIFSANKQQDLLAVPCFLMIVDGKYLESELLTMLDELDGEEKSVQPKIVVIGLCAGEIPETLNERMLTMIDVWRNLPVRKLIRKEYELANAKGVRKDAFKGMIRRIIFTLNGEENNPDEVSKSSAYRDQKIIEKAGVLSNYPAPCKRPERIVAMYLYMKKNIYLSREYACASFGISERTLNRDLAVLAEVLNEEPYYYDNSNGCYR